MLRSRALPDARADPLAKTSMGKPRLPGEEGAAKHGSPRFAEMVVNAPKSLAIAAAVHPDVSDALDAAHVDAVAEVRRFLGLHSVTRVGPRGRQEVVLVERLQTVAVVHRTSRAGDPHRHTVAQRRFFSHDQIEALLRTQATLVLTRHTSGPRIPEIVEQAVASIDRLRRHDGSYDQTFVRLGLLVRRPDEVDAKPTRTPPRERLWQRERDSKLLARCSSRMSVAGLADLRPGGSPTGG